jgi:D-alanyl-lipoteichoic acid acyltransferase DltB (MBOAT superfamily)
VLFNSLSFLVFFPVVSLFYFILPEKARNYWLLAASYYFYMNWNAKYALLLFGCTLVTYISGWLIGVSRKEDQDAVPKKQRRTGSAKLYVAVSFLLNLGLLCWFKYTNFFLDNFRAVMQTFGVGIPVPNFDIVLPVGISFFIFQALSYTMDVYRGKVRVEKNFLKYALFVSFFPQLVAGPIERSDHLLKQFDEKHKLEPIRVERGLMLMLWGYFQKMVLADRVALLVNQVFNYYTAYAGFEIVAGAVFFAVQVYCDFAGYSNIAIGAAQVMGFDLMQNFREPYLARSVGEFWRRWHISLTLWFRDYLYFPLGGSRTGKLRHYLNIMVVFLVSGLWHGAMWTYVIWGGMNGLFQMIGSLTAKRRAQFRQALHIKSTAFSYKLLQVCATFCLVDFSFIFFRANSVSDAFGMIARLFSTFNPWILLDGTLYTLGLNQKDFLITLAAVGVLFAVDVFHRKGMELRSSLLRQNRLFRWAVCYGAIFTILIFGSYGPDYNAASFIYFRF